MINLSKIVGEGVSYETYSRQAARRGEKDFSMSRGEIVSFAECPKKWLDGAGVKEDSTSATDWGSLIDTLLTAPEQFNDLFSITPETYPDSKTKEPKPWNRNATFCKEWEKEQSNKITVKPSLKSEADKAVDAIRENGLIYELFQKSKKQVMICGFWDDKPTGIQVPVRVLIDLLPPAGHPVFGKWISDLKTARSGNPMQWPRVVDDCAYDVQAALIMDLHFAATHEDRTDFVHVIQENSFPFHVTTPPPALSSEFLDWGRSKYKRALALYCQCLATGVWPSYEPVGIQYGNTQIISADALWNYRQCAGMREIEMPEPRKESSSDENDYLAGA